MSPPNNFVKSDHSQTAKEVRRANLLTEKEELGKILASGSIGPYKITPLLERFNKVVNELKTLE